MSDRAQEVGQSLGGVHEVARIVVFVVVAAGNCSRFSMGENKQMSLLKPLLVVHRSLSTSFCLPLIACWGVALGKGAVGIGFIKNLPHETATFHGDAHPRRHCQA